MIHYIEPDQLNVVRCMQEDMAGRPPGRNRSRSNATPTPSDSPLIQQMGQVVTQMMEAQGREDRYQSFCRHDLTHFLWWKRSHDSRGMARSVGGDI
jgi:hypothetical protein